MSASEKKILFFAANHSATVIVMSVQGFGSSDYITVTCISVMSRSISERTVFGQCFTNQRSALKTNSSAQDLLSLGKKQVQTLFS